MGARLQLEEDGTLVTDEDYFQGLENNKCLVLVADGEEWTGVCWPWTSTH